VDITSLPKVPRPCESSPEARALGLVPTEPICLWQLRRTAERHPTVFDAVARFVHRGHSRHLTRGNHDSEWRWPAVQEEFRRILAERSGCPRRRVDRRAELHDWFYLEPGLFYAELGHAHAQHSLPADRSSAHHQHRENELPLSPK